MRSFRTERLSLLLPLLIFLTCSPGGLLRAEEDMTPSSVTETETRYGYYGYRHEELHASGVIQELMNKTGTQCCDGGMGGECRVTTIRFSPEGTWEAYIDGVWTRIQNVTIHYDIPLPNDAPAVVCASRHIVPEVGAKGVYCVAASFGT